jgi:hypothetical protein
MSTELTAEQSIVRKPNLRAASSDVLYSQLFTRRLLVAVKVVFSREDSTVGAAEKRKEGGFSPAAAAFRRRGRWERRGAGGRIGAMPITGCWSGMKTIGLPQASARIRPLYSEIGRSPKPPLARSCSSNPLRRELALHRLDELGIVQPRRRLHGRLVPLQIRPEK